jgi:hypothetical protein
MPMPILHFEHRGQPPISSRHFAIRLLRHGGYAALLVGASLVVGTAGYHLFAHQLWIDALLNAAMLLGGMGPIGAVDTTSGKLFAAAFALYSGLVFLVAAGLLLAPVFHRVLHRFHSESGRASSL